MNTDPLLGLVGRQVAGYELESLLGEGGMAAVFLGRNSLNRRITRAIKVVRPELACRSEFRDRFLDEATILEGLQHQNVVRFFGVREDQGWLIMELEYLQGRPMSELMGAPGADLSDAVGWLRQACEGVAAAHDLQIVHRDLKPENLYLTDEGRVVVLDFGIAKALDDADRISGATRIGTVPGSPPYMAPEVCEGAVPSAASDVYALGICFYELLLGRHPLQPEDPDHPGLSSTQMMLAHIQQKLPPIQSLRSDVPDIVARVLARATAKDPAERFASARGFADALRGADEAVASSGGASAREATSRTRFALPTTGGSMPSTTADSPQPEKKRASAGVIIGVGAFLTLGIGAGIIYILTRPPPPEPPPDPIAAPAQQEVIEEPPPNPWVLIEAHRQSSREPLRLGLAYEDPDDHHSGFRPSLDVRPPSAPYEIHRHEVRWGELDAWLEETGGELSRPGFVPGEATERESWPATGVPWDMAISYCNSLGGSLPSEEQWEYAARGPELRPYPWGRQTIDLARTHIYQGADGLPQPVETSDQDRTPGTADQVIHDLLGNAQEWTADLWRGNAAGDDASWAQSDDMTFRAVRGLPLRADPPRPLPENAAAFRTPLCATGECPETPLLETVGFRCVRAPEESRR